MKTTNRVRGEEQIDCRLKDAAVHWEIEMTAERDRYRGHIDDAERDGM